MKKYIVTDKETNNWNIGAFDTIEDAQKCVEKNEKEDIQLNQFTDDFYQIIEKRS